MSGLELHHDFSPSSLPRRELCAGSWMAEKDLPEESSEVAIEGSLLHAEIAKGLQTNAEVVIDNPALNAEQVEIVTDCVNFGRELIKPFHKFYVEQKLRCDLLDGTPDLYAIMNNGSRAVLCEWKMGRIGVDDAIDNIQVASQAYLLHYNYHSQEVAVFIKQPRIHKVSDYTFTEFLSIREYIAEIIQRCKEPNAPRIVGNKQCQYCKARGNFERCPESCNQVFEIAKLADTIESKLAIAKPEQLVELLDACKLVANIKAKTEERICSIIKEQGYCGNMTLITTKGNREINNIPLLFQEIQDVMTQEEFLNMCKLPVGELEDTFSRKAKEKSLAKTLKEGLTLFEKRCKLYIGRGTPTEKLVKKKE